MADGSEARSEQLTGGFTAAFGTVSLGFGGDFQVRRIARDGFKKGFLALVDGRKFGVVADERHSGMAEVVQILNGFLNTFAILHADVGDVLARCTDVVEDDRHIAVGQFFAQGRDPFPRRRRRGRRRGGPS